MAVMKMAFPAEYIAGIMVPGLAAEAPGTLAGTVPAAVEMSDGGPAEEATEPPANAVPGTRGAPYMSDPVVRVLIFCTCINSCFSSVVEIVLRIDLLHWSRESESAAQNRKREARQRVAEGKSQQQQPAVSRAAAAGFDALSVM